MDQKKTYYNSILASMQPKFKFKRRANKVRMDEDGYSYRDIDDLTSVAFSDNMNSNNYLSGRRGKS